MSGEVDPKALGLTVVALSIALEETLKVLADKHGGQAGQWLDEAQDLTLLRGQAHLNERAGEDGADAAKAALAVAERISFSPNPPPHDRLDQSQVRHLARGQQLAPRLFRKSQ
jgi:hypothetical protein